MFLMGSALCIVVCVVCADVEDSEEHYWSARLAPLLHQTGCVQHDSTLNFALAAQEKSIESLIQTSLLSLANAKSPLCSLVLFSLPSPFKTGSERRTYNYDVRQSLHQTSTRAAANSIKTALSSLSASWRCLRSARRSLSASWRRLRSTLAGRDWTNRGLKWIAKTVSGICAGGLVGSVPLYNNSTRSCSF